MKTVKELLKNLEIAEIEADKAEHTYELDPMNKEAENAFDEAYTKEFNLYVATAKEIVKITNNNIDFMTAKALVKDKRNDLKNLLANN